jgi:hypothetical protein
MRILSASFQNQIQGRFDGKFWVSYMAIRAMLHPSKWSAL